MDRTEYLASLERCLVGRIDPDELRDIMNYYQDYINTEIAKGKAEQEVLSQLGEPRLLSKSILAAHVAESAEEVEERPVVVNGFWDLIRNRPILILYGLIAVVLFFGVISILFAVVGAILPFAIVFLAAVVLYRLITKN